MTLDLLLRLRTPEGAALLERAAALEKDPFAASRLRGHAAPDLAAAAVEQIRLRRRASRKFSRAQQMWFTSSLLEQASAEVVSRYRARRYAPFCTRGDPVADLCCGLGGDSIGLAEQGAVQAMDADPLSLALSEANAEAYGLAGRVHSRLGVLPGAAPPVTAAWIDPARREPAGCGDGRDGRRTRNLEVMSPRLSEVLALSERIPNLGVKLSPAAPESELARRLTNHPHERELISVAGELREQVVWLGELGRAGTHRATLLPVGATLEGHPKAYERVASPGSWLIEPDGAVIRAGLVGNLADQLGAWPIDPRLAYLSSDRPTPTALGTWYRVGPPERFSGKALGARLRALGAGDVVFKTRGAAVQPEILRQQVRAVLKQGEPACRPVVFITRLGDRPVMIVGERFGPGNE